MSNETKGRLERLGKVLYVIGCLYAAGRIGIELIGKGNDSVANFILGDVAGIIGVAFIYFIVCLIRWIWEG